MIRRGRLVAQGPEGDKKGNRFLAEDNKTFAAINLPTSTTTLAIDR